MTNERGGAVVLKKGRAAFIKRIGLRAVALLIPLATIKLATLVFAGSEETYQRGAPHFTLEQAIETALQRNPDILRARQEIERTKGVVLEVRAAALPHVTVTGQFDYTDPNLNSGESFGTTTGGGITPTVAPTGAPTVAPTTAPTVAPTAAPTAAALFAPAPTPNGLPPSREVIARPATAPTTNIEETDKSYNLRITGSQLIFNGTALPATRGAFFQRDSAYFAFRNTLDQVISTVKQQFYQVVVNKALIGVQEESVRLLQSQLQDQQNRFEAGTVPRFNVLQAQVALSNQYPNLIAARNNYRISQLQLAKTIGLDFDPNRGNGSPLEVDGELVYIPRNIPLTEAIELGKQHRPFLKQARANVLSQIEQVHVAIGEYLPSVSADGGYEILSSPTSDNIRDVSKGWFFGLTGTWYVFDSGEIYGRIKQQRALLSEARVTYDDDVRQVELEVQQAYSNLQQNRELIQSGEKTVEQAEEATRLAKARLDAGAGTQLDVLNAQVQLTTAESTRLQALFGYNAALAEFDRVTGTQSTYTESFDYLAPHATRSSVYDTGGNSNSSRTQTTTTTRTETRR